MRRVSPAQPQRPRDHASGSRKWNSVSDGTTLMPSPARTMPITVASWSTSISVLHLQRMQRRIEVLAHAAVRDRWMNGYGRQVARTQVGAASPADGRAGRRDGSGRCRTARRAVPACRPGSRRSRSRPGRVRTLLDAGLGQHVRDLELDAGMRGRGSRASTAGQPARRQRRQQRDRRRGRAAAPRSRAHVPTAPHRPRPARAAPTPRTRAPRP